MIAARRIEPLLRRIVGAEAPTPAVRVMRTVLAGAATPYGWAVRLRNAAYDRGVFPVHRLPCRVVSVGNLTVGGTGKTPTVIALARRLAAAGVRPCIVIRGYGGAGGGVRVVADGVAVRSDWRDVGDEAVLLAEALPGIPVLAGGDRVVVGRLAVQQFRPEVILLDDGFQHRRIFRDADLVLVDATDPFGGGRLVPRGRLREPLTSLRRAHAILVTRVDQVEDPQPIRDRIGGAAPGRPVGTARFRPIGFRRLLAEQRLPPGESRGKRVVAVSGIGNPSAFHRSLERLGADVADHLTFPDHHPFCTEDQRRILTTAKAARAEWIVTTEKDAVRLSAAWKPDVPVFAMEIALEIASGAGPLSEALGVPLRDATHG